MVLSRDEYFINVSQRKFDAICVSFGDANASVLKDHLLNSSNGFVELSNSHKPFMKVGTFYKSNVNLILRFFYNLKNTSLNRSKQFQIRSGFIFEDLVKRELSTFGFQMMDVKRIKKKEFDVVTVRDGIIFNFQCKNNFIDITLIEKDPVKFARKNNLIVRYFQKAIVKEINRQHLLIEKYGIEDVRHFVVSKFPVVTNEPSIVMFKDLNVFRPVNKLASE